MRSPVLVFLLKLLRLILGEFAYHAPMPHITVLQQTRKKFNFSAVTRRCASARQFILWALLVFTSGLYTSGPLRAEEVYRGPDVVIIAGEDKVVYEFRQNGELRMVRIEPKWGKPYYLVPRDSTKGFGDRERADMLLPQWVIAEF